MVDIMRLDNGVPKCSNLREFWKWESSVAKTILEQVRRDTSLSITEVQVERVLNGKSCSIS